MREAPPPSWDGSDGDYCQGPLAFAKGPLLLLSRPLIAEIVGSAPFARAAASRAFASGVGLPAAAAHEHPELLLEAGSRDVLEDVQLGWWVAAVPDVRLVHLHETSVWSEGLGQVDDLGRLLVAHQVPWARLPWLTRQTDLLWKSRAAAGARQRLACLGAPCERSTCAHDPTQRACAVVIELGRGANGSAPRTASCSGRRRRRAAAGAAAGASASASRAAAAAATRGAAAAARGRGARARRRRSCVYVRVTLVVRSTQGSSRGSTRQTRATLGRLGRASERQRTRPPPRRRPGTRGVPNGSPHSRQRGPRASSERGSLAATLGGPLPPRASAAGLPPKHPGRRSYARSGGSAAPPSDRVCGRRRAAGERGGAALHVEIRGALRRGWSSSRSLASVIAMSSFSKTDVGEGRVGLSHVVSSVVTFHQ